LHEYFEEKDKPAIDAYINEPCEPYIVTFTMQQKFDPIIPKSYIALPRHRDAAFQIATSILYLSNCIGGELVVECSKKGRVAIHPRPGRRVIFSGVPGHAVACVREGTRFSLSCTWMRASYYDRKLLSYQRQSGFSATQEFYSCLRTIFATFDQDDDGVWNKQEICAFLSATHSEVSDRMIDAIVAHEPNTAALSETGPAITFEAVLAMYVNMAMLAPEAVWADLSRLDFHLLID